jgi:beta-lactamase regulating signal transducer with metallopeptidase domain
VNVEPVAVATRTQAALTWRGGLFVAWAAIVLLQVARLVWQRVRLARILRGCEPADLQLAEIVDRLGERLGLARRPRLLATDLASSPFVCGLLQPALVVPRELAATLARADLEQVVAHELAHVARRDLVWGWIPEIARVLFFFHPVAHLACQRIRLERELACDQQAMLTSGRRPGEYAETLVRVLGIASRPGMLGASAANLSGEQ